MTQSERQIQFVDNLTKIHGNHSFKFGADLRYAMNLRVPSDSHRAGELYFNGNNTGYVTSVGASPVVGLGLATFLLGDNIQFRPVCQLQHQRSGAAEALLLVRAG